jgi:hypothetical protein
MKKTQKQIFGCFGLGLVAAMTITAALMPSPQASAITTTIKDNIEVKVIGVTPAVSISGVEQGGETTATSVTFTTTYENIETIHYKLEYTNPDGTKTVFEPVIPDKAVGYESGSVNDTIDFSSSIFNIDGSLGYGSYVLTVTGTGYDGAFDEKSLQFERIPLIATAKQNEETGKTIDVTIEDLNTDDISDVDIYIDDEKVGTVHEDGTYPFNPPSTGTKDYVVKIVARDGDKVIYVKTIIVHYEGMRTPDTGSFFQNLNISKEDYLITGLIVFFILGIVGFGIVARGKRTSGKTNKRG